MVYKNTHFFYLHELWIQSVHCLSMHSDESVPVKKYQELETEPNSVVGLFFGHCSLKRKINTHH